LPTTLGAGAPAVSSIQITPPELPLFIGSEFLFGATAFDSAGNKVNDVDFRWTLSDERVATIVSPGKVRGAVEGETRLIASSGDVASDPALIHVLPPPVVRPAVASIDTTPRETTLKIGEKEQLVAVAKDQQGILLSGVNFTWNSSDSSVAAVDANGFVTAERPGTAIVTVSAEGAQSISTVTVLEPQSAPPPGALFSATPPSGTAPLTVQFSASSRGTGSSYLWEFGDGASSSAGPTVSHTYSLTGSFTAKLTVTDNRNVKGTFTTTITVGSAQPGNARIGWAVGGVGTTNATALQFDSSRPDKKWSLSRAASAPASGYYGLSFFSPTNIWMAGWGGLIMHSSDGGITWNQQNSNTTTQLRRIFFSDEKNGWIAGQGQIFRTTTGGNSWLKARIDGDLFGIHFVSASTGWTVGLEQVIEKTDDGGVSWTRQSTFEWKGTPSPANAPVDFYDVTFVDANTGWAVGWPEAIFKTTDGGATWVEQRLNRTHLKPPACDTCKKDGVYLRKVQFLNSQHGWAVGRFGYIFKTDDGGATWIPISQDFPRPLPHPCVYPTADHIDPALRGKPRPAVTDYNPHFFAVDIVGFNEVWVGGGSEGDEPCAKGYLRSIMHTADGGKSWEYFYESETDDTGTDPRAQLDGNGRIFDLKFR
jgi:photosystem II stability/assembly factor-like uncharacterized protein